ncbi:hypothetical protein FHS90_004241 [Rufibacter quisquiliarum]|uniref:Uncharacterized protein n=1 Tax=Rufibacter quisquiliarum TaxID=1549639 RepID=A0A839GNI2_9BACT|nr:hypothetical protein [Rufibacter quisquiliarum]
MALPFPERENQRLLPVFGLIFLKQAKNSLVTLRGATEKFNLFLPSRQVAATNA